MEKKMVRISEIVVLMVAIISFLVFGCQAPPPAQTPPPAGTTQTPPIAGTAQMPAPAGTAQVNVPTGSAQMPTPGGSAQMPIPAGTTPITQAGTPSQDPNQIQVGMTPVQIQQIMGSPEQLYQQGFIEWKYTTPLGKVDVRFKDNKVILVEKYNNK